METKKINTMSMRCTVCAHEHVKKIDREIIANVPLSTIAREYNLHPDALARHRDRHLVAQLRGAATRSLKFHTRNLLADMQDIMNTSKDILESALADGSRALSLKAIKEVRNNVEVLGKIIFAVSQQQSDQLDEAEIEEFKRWKYEKDAFSDQLRSLSDDERAQLRSMCIKKISSLNSTNIDNVTPSVVLDPNEEELGPHGSDLGPLGTSKDLNLFPEPDQVDSDTDEPDQVDQVDPDEPRMRRTTPKK